MRACELAGHTLARVTLPVICTVHYTVLLVWCLTEARYSASLVVPARVQQLESSVGEFEPTEQY